MNNQSKEWSSFLATRTGIPQKRGKMLLKAMYAILYGAGNKQTVKVSGLSLRRVKVLRKNTEIWSNGC